MFAGIEWLYTSTTAHLKLVLAIQLPGSWFGKDIWSQGIRIYVNPCAQYKYLLYITYDES